MECITVTNVSKRYGETLVLKDLSFEIPCQERYSLLGPNGAGKSTTMKILAGLAKPDSGEVRIMGLDPESLEAKKVLGYLPEDALPYRNLSVRENLEYIASLRGLRDGKERVENLLDRLGLRQYERVQAGKLSRGNLQKLAIALSIIHSPRVLLLDEPLNYLDIPTQEEVIALLKEMNSTFLISTHIMSIALRLTDNAILMSGGRIVWRGSISELRTLGKENEPIESVVARMMRGAG